MPHAIGRTGKTRKTLIPMARRAALFNQRRNGERAVPRSREGTRERPLPTSFGPRSIAARPAFALALVRSAATIPRAADASIATRLLAADRSPGTSSSHGVETRMMW
jgi:hypothetical protein